jgi:NAD(P)-dependent dehydrogenase (short-subunit alcohol dehydrogenase family)
VKRDTVSALECSRQDLPGTPSFTLITGASSGLGRAAAIRLSTHRRLLLNGRDQHRLEETRALCSSPEDHVVWAFDLVDTQAISASLSPLLLQATRTIDAFVHCAGQVRVLPARSLEPSILQQVMAINFFSAAEILRLLLKRNINHGDLKTVLFISSIWSSFGARGHSAYCATKAALDGFMRSLAVELAPAIRVNSIQPGAIQTRMAENTFADPAILEKFIHDYPLGLGNAEDIADMIEFLLSDRARWITGQNIVVDGGRTINMSLK